MFRNIYSTTANQINDPLVFFQTHNYHATTETLRFILYMGQVYVQATLTIKPFLQNVMVTLQHHTS